MYYDFTKIIDKEKISDSNNTLLQDKIENFTLNFEKNLIDDLIKDEKDEGKFSTIIMNLNNYTIKPLETILFNFTHSYSINGYKKLILDIKNGDKKVNFYLLFFVLEANVNKERLNYLNKIEDSAKILNFKNKTQKEK